MTRKDYRLIADAIRKASVTDGRLLVNKGTLIALLCEDLKADNPNFDMGRFTAACQE